MPRGKVSISKITIELGDRTIELTDDEAGMLFLLLEKKYGSRYVYQPYWPSYQRWVDRNQPEITYMYSDGTKTAAKL